MDPPVSKIRRSLSATYSRAARRRTLSASTGVPLVRKLGELSDSSSSDDDSKNKERTKPGAKRLNSLGDPKDSKGKGKELSRKQSIGRGARNERGIAQEILDASQPKASRSRSSIQDGRATTDETNTRVVSSSKKINGPASPVKSTKSRARGQNRSAVPHTPSVPPQTSRSAANIHGPSSPLSSPPPSDWLRSSPRGSLSSSPDDKPIRAASLSAPTPTKHSPPKPLLEDSPMKTVEISADLTASTDLQNDFSPSTQETIGLIGTEAEEDLPEFDLQAFKLPKNKGGLANRMMKRAGSSQDALNSFIGATDSIHNVPTGFVPPPIHPALSNLAAHSSMFETYKSSAPLSEESSDTGAFSAPASQLISLVSGPSSKPQSSTKKTYGGASRSMLATTEAGLNGEGEGLKRESYLTLAKRWGVDESQELKEQTIGLPTLNELRARGENQRFLDDLGYILGGLQGDSLMVKRPSAVDLIRRMLDTDFRISIKTLDEAANLYGVLRKTGAGDGDYVLDASLILYLDLLAQDSRAAEVILTSYYKDCFNIIREMIKTKNDGFFAERKREAEGKPIKTKDKATSKLLKELARIYSVSDLGRKTLHVSLRGIASSFLASIVAADKGARFDRHLALMQAGMAEALMVSLEAELGTLSGRLKDHEIGLPLLPEHEPPDIGHAERCLSVLESLYVRFEEVEETIEKQHPQLPSLLGTLLAVALRMMLASRSPSNEADETETSCVISCLRVLVNITRSQAFLVTGLLECPTIVPTIFRLISTSAPLPDLQKTLPTSTEMGEDDIEDAHMSDAEDQKMEVLCLSLGLLNNLVEKAGELKDRVRLTEMSKTCDGSRTCALNCRCPDRRSVLYILVDLFVSQSKQDTSPEASYLSGYAVLLLSHFMNNNQANIDLITDALRPTIDKPSDAASTISSLAAYLKDFADVHQRFHQKITTIARVAIGSIPNVPVQDVVTSENENDWDKVTAKVPTENLPAVIPSVEEGVDAIRLMALEMERLALRLTQSAA